MLLFAASPAHALPTMIRLGYGACAACHIAPQGGGLLTEYGRGIDDAQSLRAGDGEAGEASADGFRRLTHDLRFLLQERGSVDGVRALPPAHFVRLVYRNSTQLTRRIRLSAVVGAEYPGSFFVAQALAHYRPTDTIEISVGRDQLPSGLNLPDLSLFIKSRNAMTFHDYPTQAKVAWWGERGFVSTYAFAPSFQEASPAAREWGVGALGELDLSGQQTKVVGVTLLTAHASAHDRQTVGAYARLGFGRWGLFAEYDLTRRDPQEKPSLLQHTSYLQWFYAVREWLVVGVAGEHLLVQDAVSEQRLGAKAEVAMRFSPRVTLAMNVREVATPSTGESILTGTVQLYVKTVD
jgi:hypothetical protein